MHKPIFDMRFIAASHKCPSKEVAATVTKGLKLLLRQHRIYCRAIQRYTGVNRMWIIDNSVNVLEAIEELNEEGKNKRIQGYDFKTMYDRVDHDDLKMKMKWVVAKCFKDKPNKKIYISKKIASWKAPISEKKKAETHSFSKEEFYTMICFLIDHSYIKIGSHIFRQIKGIPMGTSCSPYLANLYLYAIEFAFLEKLTRDNIFEARKYRHTFRYIDDLLCFNNDLSAHINNVYPDELVLKKANIDDKECTFLDIKMNIDNERRKIKTTLYDKREDFSFTIVNFPFMSSNIHFKRTHGVFISQLIRYVKVMDLEDFCVRAKRLADKLCTQGFSEKILRQKFSLFYTKYYHVIKKYQVSRKYIMSRIF